MAVTISKKTSRDKQKVWYYIEWGNAKVNALLVEYLSMPNQKINYRKIIIGKH